MDFAVLDEKDVEGVKAEAGVALIAREDMEGLDLTEGAKVRVFVPGTGVALGNTADLVVKPHKKLRRRVVVLHEKDRGHVAATPTSKKDVKPVEVPGLPNAGARRDRRPEHAGAGRRRVPLVLLRGLAAVVEHAPLAVERARAPEGDARQAAERLLVLHHLREHRRLRPERAPHPTRRSAPRSIAGS